MLRIRNIVGMTFKKRIRISMGFQTFLAAFFVENGHEISCKQSSTQLGLSASLVFIIEFQGIYWRTRERNIESGLFYVLPLFVWVENVNIEPRHERTFCHAVNMSLCVGFFKFPSLEELAM